MLCPTLPKDASNQPLPQGKWWTYSEFCSVGDGRSVASIPSLEFSTILVCQRGTSREGSQANRCMCHPGVKCTWRGPLPRPVL